MRPLWAWSLWTSEPPLAVLASLPSILVSELAMRPMLPSESGLILPSMRAPMGRSEPASVLAAARA